MYRPIYMFWLVFFTKIKFSLHFWTFTTVKHLLKSKPVVLFKKNCRQFSFNLTEMSVTFLFFKILREYRTKAQFSTMSLQSCSQQLSLSNGVTQLQPNFLRILPYLKMMLQLYLSHILANAKRKLQTIIMRWSSSVISQYPADLSRSPNAIISD